MCAAKKQEVDNKTNQKNRIDRRSKARSKKNLMQGEKKGNGCIEEPKTTESVMNLEMNLEMAGLCSMVSREQEIQAVPVKHMHP